MVKYQIILHFIVLIWGLTGILGDQILLPASNVVFFRTAIAFFSLILIGFFIKKEKTISFKKSMELIGVGVIVGAHWFTFFLSIKLSTVSIGVVCMSLTTLFVSFIEPIVFKRKLAVSEIVISIFILIGIVIIFGFEFKYILGILTGVTSAFLAALFSVFNGKLIKKASPFIITKFEMLGALLISIGILFGQGDLNSNLFNLTNNDLLLLIVLGLVCTTFAFLISVWVMKYLSPFTVSMSINMEPIYTIILAVLLFPEKEKMSIGFYFGGLIIIGSIFINAYLKKINRSKIVID